MGVKGCAIHLSFSSGNGVLNAYKPPKSTRTQGGDTIADYITADTKLPAYLPYPRFLFKMEISQTAKLLYALLLDRSTLSQKNKWQDDEGNCLLLDDGVPCVCVQSISYSLMCRWFRVAVLPLDGELAAALLYRGSRKRCAVCGAAFVPKSNRGKYCPDCAGRIKKIKAAERKRKQRQKCHALEPFKPA